MPGPPRRTAATNAGNICNDAVPADHRPRRAAVRHYGHAGTARSSPAPLFEPRAQALAHHADPRVDLGDLGVAGDAAHLAKAVEECPHHLEVKPATNQRDMGAGQGPVIGTRGELAHRMRTII